MVCAGGDADLEHGGCYHQGDIVIDRKLVGSGCCRHFWPPPIPSVVGQADLVHRKTVWMRRAFHDAVLPRRHEPGDVFVVRQRHAARACGRYAVSMSGEVRTWHEDAATFARFVLLEGKRVGSLPRVDGCAAAPSVGAFGAGDAAAAQVDGGAAGAAAVGR